MDTIQISSQWYAIRWEDDCHEKFTIVAGLLLSGIGLSLLLGLVTSKRGKRQWSHGHQ